jgi:hypothetical protein
VVHERSVLQSAVADDPADVTWYAALQTHVCAERAVIQHVLCVL